ncbi:MULTISPECIES: cation:proton antiporter domain-containing protein [unclassified Streptomyces]|uniref:cation:proton antiporter domain-containing protein n=1 Tax=unclassified Streptomyces TaxID=2593676 RepID=UPI0033AAF25B
MGGTVSLVLLLLFLWGLCSQRVERVELTAPAVFVLVGLVLATCLGSMDLAPSGETVKGLAEICLTWILFADAARLSFRVLRPDLGLYLRLLLIGLPLCIGLGTLLAAGLLPGVSGWAAVFVGAALAPTDAALGASMMSDPVVPERIRRLINVESGLNDGIATPVVVLALVGAAGAAGAGPDANGKAVVELAIGFAYGSVLGLAGGWLLRSALRKGWAAEEFAGPAVLALALLSYLSSIAIGGNGFVAAFVAGLAFGTAYGDAPQGQLLFTEQSASVLSLLVWLLFGAVLVPAAVPHMTWQAVLYAVLSLTLVRMVPVALSVLGTKMDRATVLFVGWFGPRGLATIIFGLLALEDLAPAVTHRVLPVLICTVLLSVLAHGFTAGPLARRYGAATAAGDAERPELSLHVIPVRRLTGSADAARRRGSSD